MMSLLESVARIGAIVCLTTAAVLGMLAKGADEGWVTPFDDAEQRRTIWRGVKDLAIIGVGLAAVSVLVGL